MSAWPKGTSGNPAGRPRGSGLEQLLGGLAPELAAPGIADVWARFLVLNARYGWFTVDQAPTARGGACRLRTPAGALVRAYVALESRRLPDHGDTGAGYDLILAWRHNWTTCPRPCLCLAVEWANYQQWRRVQPDPAPAPARPAHPAGVEGTQ